MLSFAFGFFFEVSGASANEAIPLQEHVTTGTGGSGAGTGSGYGTDSGDGIRPADPATGSGEPTLPAIPAERRAEFRHSGSTRLPVACRCGRVLEIRRSCHPERSSQCRADDRRAAWRRRSVGPGSRRFSSPVSPRVAGLWPGKNSSGTTPIPTRFETMDAFVALGDHGANAEQIHACPLPPSRAVRNPQVRIPSRQATTSGTFCSDVLHEEADRRWPMAVPSGSMARDTCLRSLGRQAEVFGRRTLAKVPRTHNLCGCPGARP